MIRDRAWIAARIPHSGTMCLLDRVVEGDAGRIVCAATSHRDAANPLRAHGRLSSVHAIEYAAQAMALHRAFGAGDGAGGAPPRGILASVRGVTCHVERLDDVGGELTIEATRISGGDDLVVYGFVVRTGERELVSGRVTAVLDATHIGAAQ